MEHNKFRHAPTEIIEHEPYKPERLRETPAMDAADMYARKARLAREIGVGDPRVMEIFSREFAEQLPVLLSKTLHLEDGSEIRLQEIVDRHIETIQRAQDDVTHIVRAQQDFVQDLVATLSKLPVKNWNISPRQLTENGAANCSTAAAALHMIIESTQGATGIPEIEYANPPGHSLNIVRFPDGTIFYADPRNGIFENITEDVVPILRSDMNVYRLRTPNARLNFRLMPALKNSHDAMVAAYAGNVTLIPDVMDGNFPAAFDYATAQEKSAMQEEVRALSNQPDIASQTIEQTRALRAKLKRPIDEFFAQPDVQEELAHFEPATKHTDVMSKLADRLGLKPMLRTELGARKQELRAFLLGDAESFATSDAELTGLLDQYRTHRMLAWNTIHRTQREREREIDTLLSRL